MMSTGRDSSKNMSRNPSKEKNIEPGVGEDEAPQKNIHTFENKQN